MTENRPMETQELTPEELEDEGVMELPDREMMSVMGIFGAGPVPMLAKTAEAMATEASLDQVAAAEAPGQ